MTHANLRYTDQTYILLVASVSAIGPESIGIATSSFSELFPTSLDGYSSYSVYLQDVELWLLLISLEPSIKGFH